MSKAARAVAALVLVQAALLGLYALVEHRRAPIEALGTEPPIRIDLDVPALGLHARDGRRVELPAHRALVHVWATWCPPCRAELPGLLALPESHDVSVVAIALDANWGEVDRFLGDLDASRVVLGRGAEIERMLGVRHLPATFLLEGGRLRLRFDGARDWRDERFVRAYLGAAN